MNIFDASVIAFINDPSHRFLIVDKVMKNIVDWQLVRGGIVFTIIWGLWFGYADQFKKKLTRELIVSTLIACFFSLSLAQILEHSFLPFRIRPIFNPDIHFIAPLGWDPTPYSGVSCLPSDNATFFFTLATGIFLIERYVGTMMFLFVFLVICFPRIYLGLHYPTDILAGALLGIGVSLIFNAKRLRCSVTKPFMYLMKEKPGLFYACLFLASFEMGNTFIDVQTIAKFAYQLSILYWH